MISVHVGPSLERQYCTHTLKFVIDALLRVYYMVGRGFATVTPLLCDAHCAWRAVLLGYACQATQWWEAARCLGDVFVSLLVFEKRKKGKNRPTVFSTSCCVQGMQPVLEHAGACRMPLALPAYAAKPCPQSIGNAAVCLQAIQGSTQTDVCHSGRGYTQRNTR